MDTLSLGSDLWAWMKDRTGASCPQCDEGIEHTELGDDGKSEHRLECGCTVIECRAKSNDESDETLGDVTELAYELRDDREG